MAHFQVGVDYPAPIIDTVQTARHARQLLHQPRHTETGQAEQERILSKHTLPGSRQVKPAKRKQNKATKAAVKPKSQPDLTQLITD
jgi:deoxyribodipyrimidine photo-lyase